MRSWIRFATASAARYPQSRNAVVAAAVFFVLVAACFVVPATSPYDPHDVQFAQKLQPPSSAHPLGTDFFGRDLATRMALGGQMSMLIAFAALAVIAIVAGAYGAIAGTAGERVDAAMMRLLDSLLAIPRFPVLVIVLVVAGLSTNVLTLVIALALPSWMVAARLVRFELRELRQREFVRAAEALGARRRQVLVRHLAPNALGVLIVAVFLELPSLILAEAFASALGLGLPPPTATWGNIVYDGINQGRLYEVFLPSVALVLFAVSANLIADGLQDALDPRTARSFRGRRRLRVRRR